jgi:transcription initiation factor TFIIB
VIKKCSSCNNERTTIITDPESAEIVCSNCGMVISDKIEQNSRVLFNDEQRNDRSRTRGTLSSLASHDMGLATIIGWTEKDSTGNKLDLQTLSTMKRLRTWNFRIQGHTSTNKNLKHAFNELSILKDKLALSSATVEKSAYIYRKAQERRLARGRSISAIIGSAVYIACRELQIPKSLRDIAAANNVELKVLSRSYRILISELDMKIPIIDPMKCIFKVANKTNLNEKTKRQAMDVMNNIIKKEISAGKHPMGLAATVLYISCLNTGVYIRQADIAHAAGITEVTLRNRIKDLKDKLPQLNN